MADEAPRLMARPALKVDLAVLVARVLALEEVLGEVCQRHIALQQLVDALAHELAQRTVPAPQPAAAPSDEEERRSSKLDRLKRQGEFANGVGVRQGLGEDDEE